MFLQFFQCFRCLLGLALIFKLITVLFEEELHKCILFSVFFVFSFFDQIYMQINPTAGQDDILTPHFFVCKDEWYILDLEDICVLYSSKTAGQTSEQVF